MNFFDDHHFLDQTTDDNHASMSLKKFENALNFLIKFDFCLIKIKSKAIERVVSLGVKFFNRHEIFSYDISLTKYSI